MTLRGAIENAQDLLSVMRPVMPVVPERVNEIFSHVSERMDRVGVFTVDFDINAFSKKVKNTYLEGDWTVLSNADLRCIAIVLRSPDFPIGRESRFLRRYLREIRDRAQALPCKALISHYLRHFDDSPDIKEIGVFLAGVLPLPQLQYRLHDWKKSHARFHLFNPEKTVRQLAKAILKVRNPDRVFVNAGIRGDAQTAGIGAETFKAVCGHVRESLNAGSDLDVIRMLTRWAYPAPGKFRYQNHRSTLADALLVPWRNSEPDREVKKYLETFFDSAYGDPRFQNDRWQGSSIDAKSVRLRWLAEKDLEFFFKVVDSTTGRRDQWQYRRAFWSAYVRKGYTRGSWIAFGHRARIAARRAARDEAATEEKQLRYGRLDGGDSRHSVLFLRIGSLVIADWSFNGKLRIWREANAKAPSFYQTEEPYRNVSLMQGANFELVHWPVIGPWKWQDRAHKHILRQTGIRIAERNYMPNKNSIR